MAHGQKAYKKVERGNESLKVGQEVQPKEAEAQDTAGGWREHLDRGRRGEAGDRGVNGSGAGRARTRASPARARGDGGGDREWWRGGVA